LWIAASFFVFAGYCYSLEAEEQNPLMRYEAAPTEVDQFSPFTSFIVSLAPETHPSPARELFHLNDEWRLNSIFQKASSGSELEHDSSILLFRKQMPSRYSYRGYAGLHTGYGQFFHGDNFGRSRTNGVGINDPDWLYLKMSFKF